MFSSSLPIQHYLALFTSRRALLRHSGWQHSDAIWIHMKPQQIPLHLHIRTPECILLYTHSTHTHLHTQKRTLGAFQGRRWKKMAAKSRLGSRCIQFKWASYKTNSIRIETNAWRGFHQNYFFFFLFFTAALYSTEVRWASASHRSVPRWLNIKTTGQNS